MILRVDFLVGLGGPYGMLEIDPRWAMYKASTLNLMYKAFYSYFYNFNHIQSFPVGRGQDPHFIQSPPHLETRKGME